MRVLFIHNNYRQYGGEDVALELESKLLAERGHDVHVTVFSNNESRGLMGKIKLGWNAVYNRSAANIVRKAIRAFKPDIVHVHNWFFEASPAVLFAAAKEKVPVVTTLHNYRLICANALLLRNNRPCELCVPETFPMHGIRYKCYHHSASQSAMVTAITGIHKRIHTWQQKVNNYIVLTNFAKTRFIGSSLKVAGEKLMVKPNFIPDPGENTSAREDYFLFAGRLSIEKGVHVLFQAFAALPACKLVVVGDGEERDILQQRYATASNISFAGQLPRAALMEKMKRCKAVVFPSIWYEGLPFIILEAFATGTPVIASDLGSMSELVINGYNGFHFKAGDAQALQAVIQRMEQTLQQDQQLYANARQTYLSQYHPNIHYKSIISIYEQTIANSRNANA